MAASKQASIHTHVSNAVPLVWGLLRLTPANKNTSCTKNAGGREAYVQGGHICRSLYGTRMMYVSRLAHTMKECAMCAPRLILFSAHHLDCITCVASSILVRGKTHRHVYWPHFTVAMATVTILVYTKELEVCHSEATAMRS